MGVRQLVGGMRSMFRVPRLGVERFSGIGQLVALPLQKLNLLRVDH
jgi:hypothetical protein